jgi:hypothetical protein
MAYSISVAVGERDTMAFGRVLKCVLPPAVVTVTGKPAVAEPDCVAPAPAEETLADELLQAAEATAIAATAIRAGN